MNMSSVEGESATLASAESFVTGAYAKFGKCAMTFDPINAAVTTFVGEEEEMSAAFGEPLGNITDQMFPRRSPAQHSTARPGAHGTSPR